VYAFFACARRLCVHVYASEHLLVHLHAGAGAYSVACVLFLFLLFLLPSTIHYILLLLLLLWLQQTVIYIYIYCVVRFCLPNFPSGDYVDYSNTAIRISNYV